MGGGAMQVGMLTNEGNAEIILILDLEEGLTSKPDSKRGRIILTNQRLIIETNGLVSSTKTALLQDIESIETTSTRFKYKHMIPATGMAGLGLAFVPGLQSVAVLLLGSGLIAYSASRSSKEIIFKTRRETFRRVTLKAVLSKRAAKDLPIFMKRFYEQKAQI